MLFSASLTLKDELQVPTGTHYYQWWGGNAFHPHILQNDFRPGIPEGWKRLREGGVAILPYFNVFYWRAGQRDVSRGTRWPDVTLEPGFAAAKAYACMPYPGVEGDDAADERFEAYQDHYIVHSGNNAMVPMCHHTEFWRDQLLGVAKKLTAEGNDMVYIDQGGVPPRSPCFNPDHGHPLGGGGQWAAGMRKTIQGIKTGTGRELAICSEGAFEGYLDLVEVQFLHYWPWLAKQDSLCPLFEAIYHDHTMAVAAVKPHPDATAYAIDIGTRLLHGNQFRAEARMFAQPEFAEQSEFIRRMARLRHLGSRFLTGGELIRPPVWIDPPARVKAEWIIKNEKLLQTIGFPALERAEFRQDNGETALFIVNFSGTQQEARLALEQWTRSPEVIVSYSDGRSETVPVGNSVVIPARDGCMITTP